MAEGVGVNRQTTAAVLVFFYVSGADISPV